MSKNWNMEKPAIAFRSRYDHWYVIAVLLLVGVGIVTLYSASYAFAERFFHDRWYFIVRQTVYAALGLIAFFIVSWFPLEKIRGVIMPLVLFTMFLCLLTFVPAIGVMKNGASRWIRIGPWTYQPSELVKLVLPLYLAHIFDKKKDSLDSFARGILPPAVVTVIFFVLIYCQNNFSMAVFIAVNALVLFFLAGIKMSYFAGTAVMILPVSLLLILTKEHRLRRVLSFIWPEWEPLGAGYQVRSSILTIRSGGFWGKGIGQGTRKIASVPEIQSDFIFASYAEEAGFIGIILFLVLIAVFAIRAIDAALKTADTFKRLLAMGLGTTILSQTVVNIAVVSGSIPTTGIPLPFFSAGGSALTTTLVMAGLIANVGKSEAPNDRG
ncbi:MAG: putative lipid II flippase FtsW [Spirochaetaceae bacterium]|jgi:cell division protein FtsW|nr:putative lipid II flippase FtsW [Spirochaetaceae bacterium]